jgi:hypothetical protein
MTSPKRIKYICPACKLEQETTEWRFKRKKTSYCKNCVSSATQTGIKKPIITGENSARWKGGEYISSDGYKMIKCKGESHPSGRTKYKKEHILILEKHLNREIKTQQGNMGEQVHHIDGDKLNNDLNNLILCADTREHRLLHCQLEEIAFELVRRGVIIFNTKENKYKINED